MNQTLWKLGVVGGRGGTLRFPWHQRNHLYWAATRLWTFDGNPECETSWEREDPGFLQQIKYQLMKNHCVAKVITPKKTTTPKTPNNPSGPDVVAYLLLKLNLLRTSLSANCTKNKTDWWGCQLFCWLDENLCPKLSGMFEFQKTP